MSIYAIVAMDLAGTIGVDGGIPWRLSHDLRKFKEHTMGNVCVMGRKTFDSIPTTQNDQFLPGREIVVLTSKVHPQQRYENVYFSHCRGDGQEMVEALTLAQTKAKEKGAPHIYLCGGEMVYRNGTPLCESVFMTLVNKVVSPGVDRALFPVQQLAGWRVTKLSDVWDGPADISATYLRFDNPKICVS